MNVECCFFLNFDFHFMCEYFVFMYVMCPWRPKRGVGASGTGVTDSCGLAVSVGAGS